MTVPAERPVGAGGAARVAIVLAAFVVIVTVVSYAILLVALAIGGDAAISDTWVGAQAAFVLLGGLLTSLLALVLAGTAKVRHERANLLWLPLSLFPTLLALGVLAELLVLE